MSLFGKIRIAAAEARLDSVYRDVKEHPEDYTLESFTERINWCMEVLQGDEQVSQAYFDQACEIGERLSPQVQPEETESAEDQIYEEPEEVLGVKLPSLDGIIRETEILRNEIRKNEDRMIDAQGHEKEPPSPVPPEQSDDMVRASRPKRPPARKQNEWGEYIIPGESDLPSTAEPDVQNTEEQESAGENEITVGLEVSYWVPQKQGPPVKWKDGASKKPFRLPDFTSDKERDKVASELWHAVCASWDDVIFESSRNQLSELSLDIARSCGGNRKEIGAYIVAILDRLPATLDILQRKCYVYRFLGAAYRKDAIQNLEDLIAETIKLGLDGQDAYAQNYWSLAELYEKENRFDQAIQCYAFEMARMPYAEYPYLHIASCMVKKGDLDGAIDFLKTAKDSFGSDPQMSNPERFNRLLDDRIADITQKKASGYQFIPKKL